MTIIDSPFARAERSDFNLLRLLESDPESGNAELAKLDAATRTEIKQASGEGIIYRLTGPEPAKATPMQYGGFFLEKDRELLTEAMKLHAAKAADRSAAVRGDRGVQSVSGVWLFVDAGLDAYLDFVSDLPADVFAWDSKGTGFSLAEMRKLRPGKLCTNEPGADLPFEALGLKEEALYG